MLQCKRCIGGWLAREYDTCECACCGAEHDMNGQLLVNTTGKEEHLQPNRGRYERNTVSPPKQLMLWQ